LREVRKDYAKKHPEIDRNYKQSAKGKIQTYKRGAKKRGLLFELTLDYFKENWNKNCYYCGEVINGIGLDRVDNSIGYIKENIVNCCPMCNRMKHAFYLKDFLIKCEKITINKSKLYG
jgi:hypothetical protein